METAPETVLAAPFASGFPELSALGKRIELLRIERGLSKQVLARTAGTSRQQLWRVMTGKSELTGSLCQRLAEALRVDARVLRALEAEVLTTTAFLAPPVAFEVVATATLADFLTDVSHVERTLRTLPPGADGRRLRLDVLSALENAADEAHTALPAAFGALRTRVADGTF